MQNLSPEKINKIYHSTDRVESGIFDSQVDAGVKKSIEKIKKQARDGDNFEKSEKELDLIREANKLLDEWGDRYIIPWRKLADRYSFDDMAIMKIECERLQTNKDSEIENEKKELGNIN